MLHTHQAIGTPEHMRSVLWSVASLDLDPATDPTGAPREPQVTLDGDDANGYTITGRLDARFDGYPATVTLTLHTGDPALHLRMQVQCPGRAGYSTWMVGDDATPSRIHAHVQHGSRRMRADIALRQARKLVSAVAP